MKEKIKIQKGFIPVPLILGIIFVLLTGGVGLGVIKTQQKISKAVTEVQSLKEEKKYDDSIEKLEALENSFLVRYFGFQKDEIQEEIEENKKLLEEHQIELKKQEEKKEKKEEEEKKEKKEEKETQPTVFNCQDNLNCLIEKAKSCIPAKVYDTISLELADYTPTISFFGEIKGKEEGKCIFHIRVGELIDLKRGGVSQEKEKEELRPFIEGSEELCLFRNEDLVKWLETMGEGKLPSFEGAECRYRGLEMLKNL